MLEKMKTNIVFILFGILSFCFTDVAGLWSCGECREGFAKVLEIASTEEELSFQMEAFNRECESWASSAQEEMDCLVSLASYWPELVPLLKDDETLSDIVCDDLLPCDAQDYDSICWNCASNFLPSLSSLPPDSLIDESVAFLSGNAYCQSGGFNLPDNCTESVSKMVTFALPVVMSTWAEPDTAERYCSGLTCEYLDVTGETALMLDSMHHLMTGSDEGYDENVFTLMEECINFFNDSDLFKVNDANWGGIHQYADSWGVPGIDEYPPCPPNYPGDQWFENNCTEQNYGGVSIYEPCNYASNMAYYHAAFEMCKRQSWKIDSRYIKAAFRAFLYLTPGSGFLHGTQTEIGNTADVRINDLIGYVAHQAAVSALEPFDDPIIHEVSFDHRVDGDVLEITDKLNAMFVERPVYDWVEVERAIDMPSLREAMCGFLGTVCSIALNDTQLDNLYDYALNNIVGFTPEMIEVCYAYADAIKPATAHVNLTALGYQEGEYEGHVLGIIAKFIYAFVWQEGGLVPLPFLPDDFDPFDPDANEKGAAFMPIINTIINRVLLADYEHWSTDFQLARNVYPGEESCNAVIPHAKWHVEAGIGLVDMLILADETFQIISNS